MNQPAHPVPPCLFIQGVRLATDRVDSLDVFPFTLPLVRSLQPHLPIKRPVTFFAGENGSGKSTLLEAMAVCFGLNAEGGSRNFNFSTRVSHSEELAYALTLVKGTQRPADAFFLRAESFYNLATAVEGYGVGGYGEKSLHEQSHGESFLAVFNNRFQGGGLYLLDEPEAALSMQRQLSFLVQLHQLEQASCQLFIATHSPLLLAYPGAAILEFSEQGIHQVLYDDLEQVRLYRSFLAHPEAMIRKLFQELEPERDAGSSPEKWW